MRLRHQGKRKPAADELKPPDPGFTPYQCVTIYWLNERGITQRRLALNLEVSQSTISRAVRRGRDSFIRWDEPRLNTIMGGLGRAGPACDHPKIEVGEYVVCVVCCVSGFDEIDALQINASDRAKLDGFEAEIQRKAYEATLPKDARDKPIYPPAPLRPFAERMHPPGRKRAKK